MLTVCLQKQFILYMDDIYMFVFKFDFLKIYPTKKKRNSIFCALILANQPGTVNCFYFFCQRYQLSAKISLQKIRNLNQNEYKICIRQDLTFRFTWTDPTFYSLKKCISSSNDYSVHKCIKINKNFRLKTGNIARTTQQQLFFNSRI